MRNFMADNAKMPIAVKPISYLTAFLSGALFMTIMFALACVFGYMVLIAALKEADMRAARNAVIGISQSDRNCIEWVMQADNAWRCVKR